MPAKAKTRQGGLPSAAQLFLRSMAAGVFGRGNDDEVPFTEQDFSLKELAAIKAVMDTARNEGRSYTTYDDWYETFRALHAPDARGNALKDLDKAFSDPAFSAMMSVGRFRFNDKGQITDTYNFDSPLGNGGKVRSLAYRMGLNAEGGRPVRIDIGKLMDDPQSLGDLDVALGRIQLEASKKAASRGEHFETASDRVRALQAAQSGVRFLLKGTMEKNKAKQGSHDHSGFRPIEATNNTNSAKPDDLLNLWKRVMAAVGGQPAPGSISLEQDAKKEQEKQIGLSILQQLMGLVSPGQQDPKTSSQPAKESASE